MSEPLVFNIVWAGTVAAQLGYFVESQMTQSSASFRFVTNGCPADELIRIDALAKRHPDQVVEIFMASDSHEMLSHGQSLDIVRAARNDGAYFAFIDTDIKATGPFVDEGLALLDEPGVAGVSGGRGVWCESDVIPEGHVGVNGEYFYDADGFFFGSPHFAIYDRVALDETIDRWGLGFDSGSDDLAEARKAALEAAGHRYWLWDTGKLINTFLQIDGHRLVHYEPETLLHIGGVSHFLSPPESVHGDGIMGLARVEYDEWDSSRFGVASFCAAVLMAADEGRPSPGLPESVDPVLRAKLEMIRAEILDMVLG